MKRISISLLALFLAACAQQPPHAPRVIPAAGAVDPLPSSMARSALPPAGRNVSTAATRMEGEVALGQIQAWYADARNNCGGQQKPAYLCSGVMLRATETNSTFLPWNPNPSSSGVSFSWIRQDTNFSNLVFDYWNGFIFYPRDEAPRAASAIDVLCVFPMDSDTTQRGENGCGAHRSASATSKPCDDQGIVTSQDWTAHFAKLGNKYEGQCGWSMKGSSPANRFRQATLARQGMEPQWWAIQNEVRMAKWGQDTEVPIRAFFYVPGHAGALDKARNDQARYEATFHAFVPVIAMTLPSAKGGQASFAYLPSDQAVRDPGDEGERVPGETFEGAPLGDVAGSLSLPSMTVEVINGTATITDEPGNAVKGRHMVVRNTQGTPFNIVLHLKYPVSGVTFAMSGTWGLAPVIIATDRNPLNGEDRVVALGNPPKNGKVTLTSLAGHKIEKIQLGATEARFDDFDFTY
ncbi:hypothetical protein L2Y94_13090 [Luteibacter aegosomatis]|uniref:hypothetical protein n=1 Tax=Luteibacter aegosomatis TaxID=2911537 RepID=UPI001FF98E40|nr:hypothetical protein [Luteibacter aegosomatis]UPG84279.1 hypothetical protein L2Y94_13090 [Luteibacter aegosomatis]